MTRQTAQKTSLFDRASLTAALLGTLAFACGKGSGPQTTTIQIKGSDTMVNVAQAWAEEYKRVAPEVDVEVSGGGSRWPGRWCP